MDTNFMQEFSNKLYNYLEQSGTFGYLKDFKERDGKITESYHVRDNIWTCLMFGPGKFFCDFIRAEMEGREDKEELVYLNAVLGNWKGAMLEAFTFWSKGQEIATQV